MNVKWKFRLLISLSALSYAVAGSATFLYTVADNMHSDNPPPMQLIAGGVLLILANILFTPKIKILTVDLSRVQQNKDDFTDYIEKLGKIPIKSLSLFFICAAGLQLILSLIQPLTLKLNTSVSMAYGGLMFSYAMLASSFIYVFLDKMILHFLYDHKVILYPAKLKSNRQKIKNLVIPMFIALMSISVAFFTVFLKLLNMPDNLHHDKILVFIFTRTFPVLVIFFLLTGLLVFIWGKSTGQLFHNLNKRLEEMVSKDKDLTQRVFISSVDEIATISSKVNLFSDLICDHMKDTEKSFSSLNKYQEKLFTSINSSSSIVTDIAERITETIHIVEAEDLMVRDSLKTGKELIANTSEVARKVAEQSMSVTESSAAVEEMVASIKEVTKRTNTVKEKTVNLSEDFEEGQKKIEATVHSVSNVVELSQSLMEINSMISGIAARTNLLAMNAAIEAAHAGEAGKGFSVVADEIRKLAENTTNHTKTSSENLKKILHEIDTSLKIARETGETFNNMKEEVRVIENETLSISSSMAEHDKANALVLTQLGETKQLAGNLDDIASALSHQGQNMMNALEELEEKSMESLDQATIIKDKNSIIKSSIDELTSLAGETDQINRDTMKLIKSFRVS